MSLGNVLYKPNPYIRTGRDTQMVQSAPRAVDTAKTNDLLQGWPKCLTNDSVLLIILRYRLMTTSHEDTKSVCSITFDPKKGPKRSILWQRVVLWILPTSGGICYTHACSSETSVTYTTRRHIPQELGSLQLLPWHDITSVPQVIWLWRHPTWDLYLDSAEFYS